MASIGKRYKAPRILVVTPEITYLPQGMGNMANYLRAKAGGLADVSASLVSALFNLGADVHVALPHYRRMFHVDVGRFIDKELNVYKRVLPQDRIHLAQDRIFFYRDHVYSGYENDSYRLALIFQREVINNIIPHVNPDLIHCNDWMTGLVPGMARRLGVPSLFTLHNIHTHELTLAAIEDAGIDAAEFWTHLFYTRMPGSYESTRNHTPVDMLASGLFGAHFVNTVSPTFLDEVCKGDHRFVPPQIRNELTNKKAAGCAFGILNAPDPSYRPASDEHIPFQYSADTHVEGKRRNKLALQERLDLIVNPDAPMFFWPHRLDPVQKGCHLVTDILYKLVSDHWQEGLQVVVIANGPYQQHFHAIARMHNLQDRIAVCDFDEDLSRMGYAASDFMLMPSSFEPCGLPQMISPIYGTLPIVHDTGGLHDTVTPLNPGRQIGNGFVFEIFDTRGLRWAIDQAMAFHRGPAEVRAREIARVMRESTARFTHAETARRYIQLYEDMLDRPLTKPE